MLTPSKERFLRAHGLALKLHWVGDLVTSELDAELSAIATNFHQMSLLAALARNEAHSPAELSRVMHADPAAITRALDKLEERSFVARSHGQKDRRTVKVDLTPTGHTFLQHLSAVATGVLEARFARLTDDEFKQLTELLLILMTDKSDV